MSLTHGILFSATNQLKVMLTKTCPFHLSYGCTNKHGRADGRM